MFPASKRQQSFEVLFDLLVGFVCCVDEVPPFFMQLRMKNTFAAFVVVF